MEAPTKNILRNLVAGFLAAYGWLSFWCFYFIDNKWANAAPIIHNRSLGLIYAHNAHGHITYYSAFQTSACAALLLSSVPVFVLAIAIVPKKNITTVVTRWSWRRRWERDDPHKVIRLGALCGALAVPLVVFVVGPSVIDVMIRFGVVLHFG